MLSRKIVLQTFFGPASPKLVSDALNPELKEAVGQVESDAVDVKVKLARMFSESLKATTVV